MNFSFLKICLGVLFIVQGIAYGFEDQPFCYKDLQVNFFQDDIVKKALSLYNVPGSQWEVILNQLHLSSQDVPRRVKEKAFRMELGRQRNPLEYPFQPKAAFELLLTTLYDVFAEALRTRNVFQEGDIRGMFEYIRNQQAQRIQSCLGVESPPIQ